MLSEALQVKKPRQSNLELFRIITMFFIVAHHYVVNSGLTAVDGPIYSNLLSGKSIFLLLFGAFGKIGINCFVFITGYFMCTSQITLRKFLKLFFEVMFYRVVIYGIFLATGYTPFSLTEFIKVFLPIQKLGGGFTAAFLVFYLFIPFVNVLIKNLNERQHFLLLALVSCVYILLGSIPSFSVTFNYATWFIILYIISSYIRLYPKKLFGNKKFWIIASVLSVVACVASVIFGIVLMHKMGINVVYYFVADSNKLLAVITSLSLFMMFKNLNIKYSKIINIMGATTFGVLLIHANSATMREWLWKDLLDNVGAYGTDYLYAHAIISVVVIYIICTFIDIGRINFIEKPFFKLYDKIENKIVDTYKKFENKFCAKFNIK